MFKANEEGIVPGHSSLPNGLRFVTRSCFIGQVSRVTLLPPMLPEERPPDSPNRLAWRGLVVLGIALLVILLTLAVAHGYIQASFPFFGAAR